MDSLNRVYVHVRQTQSRRLMIDPRTEFILGAWLLPVRPIGQHWR